MKHLFTREKENGEKKMLCHSEPVEEYRSVMKNYFANCSISWSRSCGIATLRSGFRNSIEQ